MGDIKLFGLKDNIASELSGTTDVIEKSLQTLFEKNLPTLLGTRFLASEYRATNGRIDTLGIDENNCPVIIEYKRATNENVVNQGLFYLDWLLDHRNLQVVLIIEKSGTRRLRTSVGRSELVCIAGDFSRYDQA